jgi:hypothetical protein
MSGAGGRTPCEHRNASWPSACGKPSKATVMEGDRSQKGKRLCGIHANVWARIGWKVEDDAQSGSDQSRSPDQAESLPIGPEGSVPT